MEQSTKLSLMRYYASMSVEQLVDAKSAIGHLLRTAKIKDMKDVKINIALINDEIASRKKNDISTNT